MIPTPEDARKATGSSFWVGVIAFWLVLFIVAVTLALLLAIWTLVEAF